jgi:hypothetical protein
VAGVLAELGAETDVDPRDLAVATVARGERPEAPLPEELDPDLQEVLILAALRDQADLVVELLGVDFRGVVGGSPPGTLLHHAAWVGDAALVGKLLARGADPAAESSGTPLAWAAHASRSGGALASAHVAVAEALAAAGAELEPRLLEEADGELAEWLDERLE